MDVLWESMKGWTERIGKVDRELQNFKEVQEKGNLIITVKDNILQKLDDSFSELQWQIDELKKTKTIDSGNVSLITPEKSRIKIPVPSFKGTDQERPIKFLNDLDKYILLMKIDERDSIQIVSQTLEGVAKDWWYVYESDVQGYEQFKGLFKDRFWNSTIQRHTRRKVEFGSFYAWGKLDRVTHASAVFGYAKELDLSYSDEELSEKLAVHFEKGIRHAFTGQQVKSKSTLFQILTMIMMIKERKV